MADLRRGWFCDHAPGRGKILNAGSVGGAGKYYFEIKATTISDTNRVCVGIANANFNLTNPASLDVAAGAQAGVNGGVFQGVNKTVGNGWSGLPGSEISDFGNHSYSVNFYIGVAVDTIDGLLWMRISTIGSSTWFGGSGIATPDPVTGTQGWPFANGGITGNKYILCGCGWENFGDAAFPVLVLNAGATSFNMTAPTGFSAWDASGGTTLNPVDADSFVALSGSNLILTVGSITGSNQPTSFVRSTTSKL